MDARQKWGKNKELVRNINIVSAANFFWGKKKSVTNIYSPTFVSHGPLTVTKIHIFSNMFVLRLSQQNQARL